MDEEGARVKRDPNLLEQGLAAVPSPEDVPLAGPAPLPDVELRFEHDGTQWLAQVAGAAAGGTGGLGLARFEAVHFFRAGSTRPEYEALIARGRFEHLHPQELARLLERATPIPPPAD